MTHQMTISKITLWHIGLPMRFTFRTSQSTLSHRESLIVGVTISSGYTGYGEVVAFTEPFYTAETLTKSKEILLTAWLPFFVGKTMVGPWAMYEWWIRYRMCRLSRMRMLTMLMRVPILLGRRAKNCACVILWLGRGLKMPSSMLIMVNKG